MRRLFKTLLLLSIVIGGGFLLSRFFDENSDPLQIQLMNWRTKPVGTGVLVLMAFVLGFLLSFLVTFTAVVAKSLEVGRLKRETSALQKMLEDKAGAHSSSSKM